MITAPDFYLNGKTALVTGSSRGLGAAIALRLAQVGANVIVTYRRKRTRAQVVADQVREQGRRAWVFPLDMSETESIEQLFDAINEQVESLDVCVLNAAATSFRPLMTADRKHLEKTYAISVFGFLRAVQLAFPMIEARGGGTILGVSGADTRAWVPSHGILAGAKAAMESMIAYLAAENGNSGVTILGVNPGTIQTESLDVMFGDLAEPLLAKDQNTHPMGQVPTANDIAEAITLLTTPAARWAHGSVLNLDGGGVFAMFGRWTRECLEQLTEPGSALRSPAAAAALGERRPKKGDSR